MARVLFNLFLFFSVMIGGAVWSQYGAGFGVAAGIITFIMGLVLAFFIGVWFGRGGGR